jgi:hypothetical protein
MAITGHGDFSIGGFLKAAITGAISGAVTFGVSSWVSSICNFSSTAVGFTQGFVQGAVKGFVTGITNAAFNTVVNGGSLKLGDMLKAGLMSAGIGGIMGGIQGGAAAKEMGLDYWSGNGTTVSAVEVLPTTDGTQYSTDAEMRADYDARIGKVDGITLEQAEDLVGTKVSLANPRNLPNNFSLDNNGFMAGFDADGNPITAGAVTTSKYSFLRGRENFTRISPAIKGFSTLELNNVFKHDFMHAWHWSSGISSEMFNKYSERATSTFSLKYAKTFNLPNAISAARGELFSQKGFYFPSSMSYQAFNKIIPTWIK